MRKKPMWVEATFDVDGVLDPVHLRAAARERPGIAPLDSRVGRCQGVCGGEGAETGEGCHSGAGEDYLKPWLYRFAGIFVSVFFVYLAVRQVDLSESLRALGTVRPGWLVAATLVYLSSFPVRALRWGLILRVQRVLPSGELMAAVFVGYMANNVLPARAGEVYRAHFLGRRAGISRSGVAASIVVERTFDGLMLVCVILFVFVAFPKEDYLGGPALGTGLIFLALAAGILLYSLKADRARRAIERGLERLPRDLHERLVGRLGFFLRGIRGHLDGERAPGGQRVHGSRLGT